MSLNIVIPMAGMGSRFASAGYTKPKPFIDVNGKPMIVRLIENLAYPGANFILIARQEHIDQEAELIKFIKDNYGAKFISIDKLTEGTACTVLFAHDFINNDNPLLIANSDQLVDVDISTFIDDANTRKLEGSILCFEDPELNPKWSFAKINSNSLVVEVKEKEAISKYATVGIYYFRKGSFFVNSAIDMIVRNDRVNNEFYTCPVYNYLLKDSNKKVGIYVIKREAMHGLGTPEDLETYLLKVASNI
jgi:UDP-N-acetylglucosamine diphosphorylase / glucose-1-phosphate thymidylyltransferase / UDP-N-acetylgalactosamine diphosphorylase / glucosamine-1-phosphate N-acetyltransferase / galactosamine-1-phosphate N-acetyltransferase